MYEAGIFQGAVFGYRMGLEYEQMSGFLGPNTKAISCTIFAVAFAVGGMIISNIVYFARRASGGG
jgi:Na+/H+ antiporter NhaA